ncbi:hypothetical protein AAG906_012202 [Vitis piasezkii]
MPSSTQLSELQLPSSTPNPVSLQSLNHVLPIKLDHNNYILWKTQMENVFFANGFEEFIKGTKPCPSKELPTGEINPEFVIFFASSKARIMQFHLEFQTAKKGADSMLEYILLIKTISDNLAAIGEPIKDRDHFLQLLEDDFSLHSMHNILLTHEQRLNHQHTPPTDLYFAAHMATIPNSVPPQTFSNSHSRHHPRPPHQIRNQHQTLRNQHQGPLAPNKS